VVAGGVIALIAIGRWIRDVRAEIASLPADRR
jgi:hypothetical protein